MMPWRRHRRTAPAADPAELTGLADTWQLVSLLLDYPDQRLIELLPVLRGAAEGLPEPVREPLLGFIEHAEGRPLADLQADYVDTFDVTRRCALHLTYFLHGDTRNRGAALIRFKQAYRRAGVVLSDEDAELPDHLCVILELGATTDPGTAWRLLNDHRVGIELLHTALVGRDSPWLPVVQALRATLPRLEGEDHEALARLIAQGPPQEEVGIDDAPYALDPALEEHLSPPGPGCGPQPGRRPEPITLGPTRRAGAHR
ncbi:nitrate reductase molybdenum cofactor assembly chaperone [Janibacter alkaliphilus]|uniref:Nitrate reductase delta subunit n=2 Tax=Janibacter alkaliphilus TaxID=1069963 RepID=A0A852X862_9MICO|nr:nitrate reductase delta subunit [Janibacter alkaliphilus]